MLHIASETALSDRFQQMVGMEYISGDLNDPKAMVKLDISNLQYADNTFDMLICSHVLEHVEDDQKAMRELSRVLNPTGWAVILVPITAHITFEDPSVTNPTEREKLFGQFDHLRRYGPDFKERLEKNGFHIQVFKTKDLANATEIERFGLDTGDAIFFGHKR